jgi:hypothetical protein
LVPVVAATASVTDARHAWSGKLDIIQDTFLN